MLLALFTVLFMQFSQHLILPLTCIAETMAAVGPVAMDEALKKGGSDLRFTLSRNDVSDQLQAAFFNNGITTVKTWGFHGILWGLMVFQWDIYPKQ